LASAAGRRRLVRRQDLGGWRPGRGGKAVAPQVAEQWLVRGGVSCWTTGEQTVGEFVGVDAVHGFRTDGYRYPSFDAPAPVRSTRSST